MRSKSDKNRQPYRPMVLLKLQVLPLAILLAHCTSGDLSNTPTSAAAPDSTNTSVPVAQSGNTAVSTSQGPTSGLIFSVGQQPNVCARVDKIALGGNVVLGACDGSSATFFEWANGQLRSNKTFCVGAPSLPSTATALETTTPLALMTCDASNTSQRFDFQPGASMGPTLGNTRYNLVAAPGIALQSAVQTRPSSTQISLLEFNIAAATNNAPGVAGLFAIVLGAGDMCIGLTGANVPSVQPCSSAANLWQAGSSGRLMNVKGNCLALDANGDMSYPQCDSSAPQQIATYNGQLWAQVNNMCVSFGSTPTAGTTKVTFVGCDTGLATQVAWRPQ